MTDNASAYDGTGRRSDAIRALVLATVALLAAPAANAQCGDPSTPGPHVGLVLSGGGALAATQLGALKVVEEAGVPIHCVVGTSMGAVVGALYASGYDTEALRKEFLDARWSTVATGAVGYRSLGVRDKEQQADFFTDYMVGIGKDGVTLPAAASSLRAMKLYLRELITQPNIETDFNTMPIPYRAVATNFTTGEAVVIDHGDVVSAALASMAVPGLYPAQRVNGIVLVDGGMSKQLPIDVARAMGADIIIAIDTTFPLKPPPSRDPSVVQSMMQMIELQIYRNQQEQLKLLRPGDLYITPDIKELSTWDFGRMHEGYGEGREAALAHVDRLKQIAAIAAPARRNPSPPEQAVTLASVAVVESGGIDEDVIMNRLGIRAGDQVTREQVETALAGVFSLGAFEDVDYRIITDQDGTDLRISASPRLLGNQLLQLGAKMSATVDGDASYQLLGRWSMRPASRRGGEMSVTAGIGSDLLLDFNYMQPIDGAARTFIESGATIIQERVPLSVGDFRIAERLDRSISAHVLMGHEFAEWGLASIGAFAVELESDPLVGRDSSEVAPHGQYVGINGRLKMDTLNALSFPVSGMMGEFAVSQYFSTDAGIDGALATLSLAAATRFGGVAGFARIDAAQLDQNAAAGLPIFYLGGFKRLSGYIENSVPATGYALGRLEGFMQLGGFDQFLTVPVYIGATFEAAYVDLELPTQGFGNDLIAGSIYGAVDTPLGPAYLAYGSGEGGIEAIYVYFGRAF